MLKATVDKERQSRNGTGMEQHKEKAEGREEEKARGEVFQIVTGGSYLL